MTVATAVDEQERRWWRTLAQHQQVDGRCPHCETHKRCWPRAEAFAALVATDRWHLGPPAAR
ncbi:hypothetical protein [Micromonospora sp. RTP1Z1]|uniref:hypothetical protein n=1 Tax=Micromonospora sp. RTP1Z1 TaxID=2994043 RepID=UPI0029C7A6EE|nr:hypothetical protein [Micromonospora sp. RTP1Z1]